MASIGNLNWQIDAECAKPENEHLQEAFFSADVQDKYAAKNLCHTCDVRADCIRWALENSEIWGVWGARDENEIRRALSVNSEGNEVRRGRFPQCPYCGARTSRLRTRTIDLPEGGRWNTARVVDCTVCQFSWRKRSSANAVDAYHAERAEKSARAEKKRQQKKATTIKQLPSSGRLPDAKRK